MTKPPPTRGSSPQLPAVAPAAGSELIQLRLAEYAKAARGAFAPATERALRADTALFTAWCAERSLAGLPATPDTVTAFIDDQALSKKPATIRRYVSSIAHVHRAADLPNPCERNLVRLALKRMSKQQGVAQRQAEGLTRRLLDRMLQACGDGVSGLRDRALLALAYDTLCRRSELVALRVEDLDQAADGDGTIKVRRSKTDQLGVGSVRYLAPDTMQMVTAWITAAGIGDGPLLRAVRRSSRAGATPGIGGALSPYDVTRAYKRIAAAAALPLGLIERISAHSTRVGAAQDMAASDRIDLLAIMQAGDWKTSAMPAHYTRRQLAKRSGAARLAQMQNRTM